MWSADYMDCRNEDYGMELKNMFPNLSAMWVRWSDYQIIAGKNGVKYVIPAKDARRSVYNPAEDTKTLIDNALNLGQQLFENIENIEKPSLEFSRKYGPIGWMTALALDSMFYTEEQTWLGDNGALFEDKRQLPTKDYIAHFLPVGKAKTQPGAAQAIGRTDIYNSVFAENYGEPLLWTAAFLQNLYQHFYCAIQYRVEGHNADTLAVMHHQTQLMGSEGISFTLTAGERPEMIWEANSLKTVLETAYSLAITDPASPLKMCKHCGKAYYNAHAKSEFCSAACRNHYNVLAFRERKREIDSQS